MISQLLLTTALMAFTMLTRPAAAYPSGPSIGVLANPGFENCTNITTPYGAFTIPTDWTQDGSGNSTSPTVVCDTHFKHTGQSSARFIPQSVTGLPNVTGSVYQASIWQEVWFYEAGQTITLDYWVRWSLGPNPNLTNPKYNLSIWYENENVSHQLTPVAGVPDFDDEMIWQHFVASWVVNDLPGSGQKWITIMFTVFETLWYLNIDDVILSAPAISGDPQFIGLRGQSYQVHGIDGGIYNLATSATTQVNARFVFLADGVCPILKGIPASNCWSHPGSYLGAIGVQQVVDGKLHTVKLIAGPATTGFALLEVDGTALEIGASFEDTSVFSVSFTSSHHVTINTAEFSFAFENSDMFVNQAVSARSPLQELTSHGLFGQTHQRRVYPTSIKYIAGDVDDYLIGENDLFGTDFVYNLFQTK